MRLVDFNTSARIGTIRVFVYVFMYFIVFFNVNSHYLLINQASFVVDFVNGFGLSWGGDETKYVMHVIAALTSNLTSIIFCVVLFGVGNAQEIDKRVVIDLLLWGICTFVLFLILGEEMGKEGFDVIYAFIVSTIISLYLDVVFRFIFSLFGRKYHI